MTIQTWRRNDFETYLESEHPLDKIGSKNIRAEETRDRNVRLAHFPHSVLLQVSYPEMDFADRWCWQQFGPSDGQCSQSQSEYPACVIIGTHEHKGTWATHWFAKTDYDFGYNEWYFVNQVDRDRFVGYLPHVNWGENFPKQPL
jgi:hypothetical protein